MAPAAGLATAGWPRRRQRPGLAGGAAYQRSQQVLTLPAAPPPVAAPLAQALLLGSSLLERRRLGGALCDALDEAYGLPSCRLVVADRPQTHALQEGGRLASKTYGYYRCTLPAGGGAPERCTIRIYHRTAIRQQVLAAKPFCNTLLHEWMHHYDFAGLHLGRSPHTTGFFTRLRWLAEQLQVGVVLPPEESGPGARRAESWAAAAE
ncbi:MAG TPA: hypothetical protein VMW49_03645 [Candidatus Dormibacteraeota bacterium]|nr:hypothetical protein [Candidatus Dormibacteraeota bacterium]